MVRGLTGVGAFRTLERICGEIDLYRPAEGGGSMSRLTPLLGAVVVLVALAVAGSALAGKSADGADPCTAGKLAAGTYSDLTFTHDCIIDSAVTINGNVTVADGVYLNAGWLGTKLTINGNVKVDRGATLGLGCAYFYNNCGFSPGPPPPPWGGLGNVTVNGNISANQALTIYLDSVIVHGNVVVNGGGDATMVDSPGNEDGLVLPIKDNDIHGSLIVYGWAGAWFGVIRNHVSGNVILFHNRGARVGTEDPFVVVPDSTEVATNIIDANLVCLFNTPHAQLGDTGGTKNTVGGLRIGECARL
jgi:hypothetical protein